MAVTAGKKIKTEVPFSHGNPSVIHQAIRFLEDGGDHIRNKVCMVIGNGEMGKMAAQTLREAGADVTVTIRQYRSGVVNIPVGCSRINFPGNGNHFIFVADEGSVLTNQGSILSDCKYPLEYIWLNPSWCLKFRHWLFFVCFFTQHGDV